MENNIDNVKDTSVDSQPTLKKKKRWFVPRLIINFYAQRNVNPARFPPRNSSSRGEEF